MNKTTTFLKNLGKAAAFAITVSLVLIVVALPAIALEHYFGNWGIFGFAVGFAITMAALLMTTEDVENYNEQQSKKD